MHLTCSRLPNTDYMTIFVGLEITGSPVSRVLFTVGIGFSVGRVRGRCGVRRPIAWLALVSFLLFLILAGVSSPLRLLEFMFKERKQTQACKIKPCLSRAWYVLLLLFYFAISVLSRVPTLGLHLVVVSGLQTKTGLSE